MKAVLNVLGAILAVILSIALVGTLIALPALNWSTEAVRYVMEPENLQQVLTDVVEADPEAVLTDMLADQMDDEALEMLLESDVLEDVLESDVLGDGVGLVVEDTLAVLTGEKRRSGLDEAAVLEFVEDHIDEIVDLTEAVLLESGYTRKELRQYDIEGFVMEQVEEFAGDISDMIDEGVESVEDSLDLPEEKLQAVFKGIDTFVSGKLLLTLIVTIAVMAVLVFLCRWGRFRGLIWLAVDTGIAAVLVLLVSLALGMIPGLIGEEMIGGAFVNQIAGSGKSAFTAAAIWYAVFVVLYIAGFVTYKLLSRKTGKAAPVAAPVAPSAPAPQQPVWTAPVAPVVQDPEPVYAAPQPQYAEPVVLEPEVPAIEETDAQVQESTETVAAPEQETAAPQEPEQI